MEEILSLKQELLAGNFDAAIKLIAELETMSRQDKINALETFLALIVSRLIVIQVSNYLFQSYINDIRNSLIEIQQRNRLGDRFYISEEEWYLHYENIVPYGILIAAETTELLEDSITPTQLRQRVDLEKLRIETLKLIRLTDSLNAIELDEYLRHNWSDRQIHLY